VALDGDRRSGGGPAGRRNWQGAAQEVEATIVKIMKKAASG